MRTNLGLVTSKNIEKAFRVTSTWTYRHELIHYILTITKWNETHKKSTKGCSVKDHKSFRVRVAVKWFRYLDRSMKTYGFPKSYKNFGEFYGATCTILRTFFLSILISFGKSNSNVWVTRCWVKFSITIYYTFLHVAHVSPSKMVGATPRRSFRKLYNSA